MILELKLGDVGACDVGFGWEAMETAAEPVPRWLHWREEVKRWRPRSPARSAFDAYCGAEGEEGGK